MNIWKYPLEVVPQQTVEMPFGSKILTVQVQQETPCLWALVDPGLYTVRREIHIVGTGHELEISLSALKYINTFQQANGSLVWHVFEKE